MRSAAASRLMQWPVQIKLLPVQAPFYQGARLLIAADCTAFSRADFHERFMKGRITLIGCPKLDEGDYAEKLTEIIRLNDIREVTIVRMEAPCCGGLQRAAETALRESGKFLPWQVVTLGRDGTDSGLMEVNAYESNSERNLHRLRPVRREPARWCLPWGTTAWPTVGQIPANQHDRGRDRPGRLPCQRHQH